jgi:hypothetical protein
MQSKMKESDPILEVENLSASTDNLPILNPQCSPSGEHRNCNLNKGFRVGIWG